MLKNIEEKLHKYFYEIYGNREITIDRFNEISSYAKEVQSRMNSLSRDDLVSCDDIFSYYMLLVLYYAIVVKINASLTNISYNRCINACKTSCQKDSSYFDYIENEDYRANRLALCASQYCKNAHEVYSKVRLPPDFIKIIHEAMSCVVNDAIIKASLTKDFVSKEKEAILVKDASIALLLLNRKVYP